MNALSLAVGIAALSLSLLTIAAAGAWAYRLERRRREDLEARGRSLVGETIVVNTPKPDDQAIRGVVVEELTDAAGRRHGFVLAASVYLEPVPGRGGATLAERPAGDVVVDAYSWLTILHRHATQEG